MLRFEKSTSERKELVKRLGELTGEKPHYTAAPRMAYEIGDWTVERDGTLTVEDDKADEAILQTLDAEGLIRLPNTEDEPEQLKVEIALPLKGHNGCTLRNLINLIYQRASLINKATGGHFYVDIDLVNALKGADDLTLEKALEILSDHRDEMIGIKVEDEKISFTGFPELADSDTIHAYIELSSFMNKQALEQKRIYPKYVDEESEKYAFRIWLTRLGMNGSEFKTTRKILMKNLSGYAAFPNEEAARKFYQRQKAKREVEKEAQAGSSVESETSNPEGKEAEHEISK